MLQQLLTICQGSLISKGLLSKKKKCNAAASEPVEVLKQAIFGSTGFCLTHMRRATGVGKGPKGSQSWLLYSGSVLEISPGDPDGVLLIIFLFENFSPVLSSV